MRAAVPTGLRVPFPKEGAISSMRPPNPANNPVIIFFVRCFLNTSIEIRATQSGIVEFNNPVIPEERYCVPHTSNPCPPTNNETPNTKVSFHCCTPMCSPCWWVARFLRRYTINSAAPDNANLIPALNSGGIVSIDTLMARKLDPLMTQRTTSTSQIFDCFKWVWRVIVYKHIKSVWHNHSWGVIPISQ